METPTSNMATPPDSNWRKRPANPIISPMPGAWNEEACHKPFAVRERDGRLLWYNGRCGHVEQIGLAIHGGLSLGF